MRRCVLASLLVAGCSTFSSNETPAPDAGVDASTAVDAATTDAGADGEAPPPCPNASCGQVLASDQANIDEVLVDEKRVYWTIDNDTGTVMALDHESTGAPYAVVSNTVKPRSLVRYSEFLHFANGSNIRHIERDAVNGGTSLTSVASGNPVTSVIRKGAFVFATVGPLVQWCPTTGNTCANNTFPNQHDVGAGARALAADSSDSRVWLATDNSMWRAEVASPIWLEWWPVKNVQAIAADQTAVFVARRGEKGILRFKRDDPKEAQSVTLVESAPSPWSMVIDSSYIFYTAIDEGLVIRVKKDGSALKVLASELPSPRGIAVRLDKVYVALGDGRIVAIPH